MNVKVEVQGYPIYNTEEKKEKPIKKEEKQNGK
jgi:hypothetical protein